MDQPVPIMALTRELNLHPNLPQERGSSAYAAVAHALPERKNTPDAGMRPFEHTGAAAANGGPSHRPCLPRFGARLSNSTGSTQKARARPPNTFTVGDA
jgi:hypothetical protein